MTPATLTNVLPLAGMLTLLALFGVAALVETWWEWIYQRRMRRLNERYARVIRRLVGMGILNHTEMIEMIEVLRRESKQKP